MSAEETKCVAAVSDTLWSWEDLGEGGQAVYVVLMLLPVLGCCAHLAWFFSHRGDFPLDKRSIYVELGHAAFVVYAAVFWPTRQVRIVPCYYSAVLTPAFVAAAVSSTLYTFARCVAYMWHSHDIFVKRRSTATTLSSEALRPAHGREVGAATRTPAVRKPFFLLHWKFFAENVYFRAAALLGFPTAMAALSTAVALATNTPCSTSGSGGIFYETLLQDTCTYAAHTSMLVVALVAGLAWLPFIIVQYRRLPQRIDLTGTLMECKVVSLWSASCVGVYLVLLAVWGASHPLTTRIWVVCTGVAVYFIRASVVAYHWWKSRALVRAVLSARHAAREASPPSDGALNMEEVAISVELPAAFETMETIGAAAAVPAATIRPTRPMRVLANDNINGLREVMNDAELYASYREFVRGEWALENILFLEDLSKRYDNTPDGGLAAAFDVMYRRYIDDASDTQINIPHALARDLDAARAAVYTLPIAQLRALFEPIREAVMVQLANESFRRWYHRVYTPSERRKTMVHPS